MAALLRHLSQDLVDGKLAQHFLFFLSFFSFLLFSSTKERNIPSSSSSFFLWLSLHKQRTAALCFISRKLLDQFGVCICRLSAAPPLPAQVRRRGRGRSPGLCFSRLFTGNCAEVLLRLCALSQKPKLNTALTRQSHRPPPQRRGPGTLRGSGRSLSRSARPADL